MYVTMISVTLSMTVNLQSAHCLRDDSKINCRALSDYVTTVKNCRALSVYVTTINILKNAEHSVST